jgi:hypothetical protein
VLIYNADMTWDDVLDRLKAANLDPIEEIYMEHYGKVLASQRPEFRGRNFRCTYGVIRCGKLRLEAFLFPSEIHLHEFLEVIGDDPWYISTSNAVLHFPETDPADVDNILGAIANAPR